MKKNKRKALLKFVRKTIREDIKQNLLARLKEVAGNAGKTNKRFEKEIEKGSKQLAKKLSKELKNSEIALFETETKVDVQASAAAVSNQPSAVDVVGKKAVSTDKSLAKPKKAPVKTAL